MCGVRGLGTAARRVLSFLLLGVFLLLSFATIIAVTSTKTDVQKLLLTDTALPAELVASVEQSFPTLASFVVVVVNAALSALVGVLGRFERHPTLSAMHRSKAITIFMSQAFNTGVLPLVVSMSPPPKAYAGAYAASCNCTGYICCAVGPKGIIARGLHATMDASWHKDVGTIVVSSMFIQAVVAIFAFATPWALFVAKRRAKRGGVLHRYDMEALYEGPEKDLPRSVGKAYAFFGVVLMYAAVEPLLYLIGVLFFAGVYLTERYAMLRIHRTPPPYSYELIHSTIGWMPWAVVVHLGFAFWGFASLPSQPFSLSGTTENTTWIPPFGFNASISELLLDETLTATNSMEPGSGMSPSGDSTTYAEARCNRRSTRPARP